MGKTVQKYRKNRYEEDDYGYKDTKQKRKQSFELKRFKSYNHKDYDDYDGDYRDQNRKK